MDHHWYEHSEKLWDKHPHYSMKNNYVYDFLKNLLASCETILPTGNFFKYNNITRRIFFSAFGTKLVLFCVLGKIVGPLFFFLTSYYFIELFWRASHKVPIVLLRVDCSDVVVRPCGFVRLVLPLLLVWFSPQLAFATASWTNERTNLGWLVGWLVWLAWFGQAVGWLVGRSSAGSHRVSTKVVPSFTSTKFTSLHTGVRTRVVLSPDKIGSIHFFAGMRDRKIGVVHGNRESKRQALQDKELKIHVSVRSLRSSGNHFLFMFFLFFACRSTAHRTITSSMQVDGAVACPAWLIASGRHETEGSASRGERLWIWEEWYDLHVAAWQLLQHCIQCTDSRRQHEVARAHRVFDLPRATAAFSA